MDDIRLRPARLDDLEDLLALEQKVFDTDQLSRRSLRAFIVSPRVTLPVAHLRGHGLAGYALTAFRVNSKLARLYSICVDRDLGRRGIGRLLLEHCEAQAKKRNCRALRLEVRVDNRGAMKLYHKAGYRDFARVEKYYEDGTAALRFEKSLYGPIDKRR